MNLIYKIGLRNSIRIMLYMSLIAILWTSIILFFTQTGPTWEVPIRVMHMHAYAPFIMILGMIMFFLFILTIKAFPVKISLRLHLLGITLAAFGLPFALTVLEPYQWPNLFPELSKLLKYGFTPLILMACIYEYLKINRFLKTKDKRELLSVRGYEQTLRK